MATFNTEGAIVKCIATAGYTDPVAGTGAWAYNEQRPVSEEQGQILASIYDKFVKVSDSPAVMANFDPVTGGVEFGSGSNRLSLVKTSYDGLPNVATSIVLDDLIATVPPSRKTALNLPNPYPAQANAPVHPSLLFFPLGWGGFRYWLAFTPYPSANSDYENPCVVASNDLMSFSSPRANPIVDKPTGTAYNADTHLVMSADGLTMYLIYRERGVAAKNNVRIIQTTDGVNWTSPVTVLTGDVGAQDFASPSAWFNGTNWVIVSHNADVAAPWPLERRVSTGADIYGPYGAPTTVTPTPAAGRSWWHSFFIRMSSGQIVGLAQDNAGTNGSTGDLYWIQSFDDGATFVRGAMVDMPGGKYRSSFAVRGDEVDLLIGTLTGMSLVKSAPGKSAAFDAYCAAQASLISNAANLPANGLWADSFVRGDSAVSLGTASSGGTYTASSGTWGISTNRAYPVTSGRVLAQVNNANHRVSVQFLDMTTGIQQWLLARVVDGSNYWRLGSTSPTASGFQTAVLQEIVAGAVANTYTVGNYQRGAVLAVECSGTTIKTLINGVCTYDMQSMRHITGTQIGLQANAGANTFMKNLTCSLL